jgi:hypothetical protein
MAKVIASEFITSFQPRLTSFPNPLSGTHTNSSHTRSASIHRKPSALCLSFVRHLLLLLGVGVVESALVAKRASESREKRKIHPSIRPHPHQGRFWIKTGPEWKKETHQGVCMRWWREERTAAAIPPPRLRWAALKLAFVLTSLAH